jgi:type I restriction enzyme S subunit
VGQDADFALGQNLVLLRADGRHVSPPFLRWLAKGPLWWEQVKRHLNVGAVFDSLRCADVPRFALPIPPLSVQAQIAALLGALDDKIALNARMNATLEAMARAVFEDWFVRFGPVRAKAEGRAPPGLAPDLAALFPDRLTETPDGEVPEGRAFCPLGDLCTLQRGFDLPKAQREDGDVPIVSSSGITGFHSHAACQPPGIVTGRYGTIGQVFMLDRPYWPLNTSLFVADFKDHPSQFVFHTLVGLPFDQFSDKAAVPGINRNHLHQARVVLPPRRLMHAFDETVGPMRQRCVAAAAESQTLTSLRDLLPPRLISGQLHLRDAERAVEAAL